MDNVYNNSYYIAIYFVYLIELYISTKLITPGVQLHTMQHPPPPTNDLYHTLLLNVGDER